jgi:NADH:ubiquinone oxidoreductase subunit C
LLIKLLPPPAGKEERDKIYDHPDKQIDGYQKEDVMCEKLRTVYTLIEKLHEMRLIIQISYHPKFYNYKSNYEIWRSNKLSE